MRAEWRRGVKERAAYFFQPSAHFLFVLQLNTDGPDGQRILISPDWLYASIKIKGLGWAGVFDRDGH